MKKLSVVVIAALALFLSIPASAQHSIGITGGLNLANISVDPKDSNIDFTNRTALGIGGILDLRLAESVALHLQPLYLQKGSKLESQGQTAKIKLAYIDIPVMVKVMLGTSTSRPYILAGPTIGFLLSAKASNGQEIDIKDTLKSSDFGLAFGAGISFPAGNNSIFVEGRYALGLSNINDDPDDPNSDVKNKGIQILAGVSFPLGGK